jgi:hypothetical protein
MPLCDYHHIYVPQPCKRVQCFCNGRVRHGSQVVPAGSVQLPLPGPVSPGRRRELHEPQRICVARALCTDNHGHSRLHDLLHATQSALRATSMPAVSLVDWLPGHVSAKSSSASDEQPVETARYQGRAPSLAQWPRTAARESPDRARLPQPGDGRGPGQRARAEARAAQGAQRREPAARRRRARTRTTSAARSARLRAPAARAAIAS